MTWPRQQCAIPAYRLPARNAPLNFPHQLCRLCRVIVLKPRMPVKIFFEKKNEFETVNMRFLVILCLGVSMLGTLRLCLCLYAVQHDWHAEQMHDDECKYTQEAKINFSVQFHLHLHSTSFQTEMHAPQQWTLIFFVRGFCFSACTKLFYSFRYWALSPEYVCIHDVNSAIAFDYLPSLAYISAHLALTHNSEH